MGGALKKAAPVSSSMKFSRDRKPTAQELAPQQLRVLEPEAACATRRSAAASQVVLHPPKRRPSVKSTNLRRPWRKFLHDCHLSGHSAARHSRRELHWGRTDLGAGSRRATIKVRGMGRHISMTSFHTPMVASSLPGSAQICTRQERAGRSSSQLGPTHRFVSGPDNCCPSHAHHLQGIAVK